VCDFVSGAAFVSGLIEPRIESIRRDSTDTSSDDDEFFDANGEFDRLSS